MRYFNIEFDEGAGFDSNEDNSAYGPYFQRQRVEIYHTYVKDLVEKGLAYPCFCTEQELEKTRQKQDADKILTGYYGEYATCRNLSFEEAEANIKAGKEYVIRLRSQGNPDKEIVFRVSPPTLDLQTCSRVGASRIDVGTMSIVNTVLP